MTKFGGFLLAIACCSLSLSGFAKPKNSLAQSRSVRLQTWVPNRALLSRLTETRPVEKFEVRPPRSYQPILNCIPGRIRRYGWHSTKPDTAIKPFLTIEISDMVLQPGNVPPIESVLERSLQDNVQRLGNSWKRTPTESGLIDGVPFARTYWSGVFPGDGAVRHGLSYVALTDNLLIHIEGMATGPEYEEQLKLIEAAIFTFKASKAQ